MEILKTAIKSIKLNPNNPRQVKDDKYKKLVQSIKDFPEMLEIRPIVVNDDMIVLGGNMRLRACKDAGLASVPIIKASELTPEQQREFIIKDNVGYGEWDWELIVNEWDADLLDEWGLDIPDDWLNKQETEGLTDDDAIPEEVEPICKEGDLWLLGEHRLLCGDATKKEDVERLMDGDEADMVFTDPPYNVNYGADKNNPSWANDRGDRTIQNDKMSGDDFTQFIKESFINIAGVCDGVIYCFGAQGTDGRIMFTVLDNLFHNSGTIVWVKDRLVLGRGKYHTRYEPCWFGWNKSGKTFTDDRTLTNVWEFDKPKSSELHPTMKPIEVILNALNHNPIAKSCIDTFLGSGSTLIACEKTNRKCYGMEIDPHYCDVIIKRWEDYTGKKAIKI